MAEFGDNDTVRVTLMGTDPNEDRSTAKLTCTASGEKVGPLKLGDTYNIMVEEVQGVGGNPPRVQAAKFTACE